MSFTWPTSSVGMLHPIGPEGSKQRSQGLAFLRLAQAAQGGTSYTASKALFDVSTNQVETRKSLYEELGLLYVPRASDTLRLTAIGAQLLALLGTAPTVPASNLLQLQVDALLCWAMVHCQINRPQSFGTPRLTEEERTACTLRPYAAFWQAVLDLDGFVTMDEFMNVLSRSQTVEQYLAAVQLIRSIRLGTSQMPAAEAKGTGEGNYRIYWTAHLTVANSVMTCTGNEFRFVPTRESLIREMLSFAGCAGSPESALTAAPWADIDGYYSDIAGVNCPPYLASGTPALLNVQNAPLTFLRTYQLNGPPGSQYVEGGPELCALKMMTPCFHIDQPERVLRVSQKMVMAPGQLRIMLASARPILNPAPLLASWEI